MLQSGNKKGKREKESFIYLSIYGFTALFELGRFLSFLIYTQSVGLLERTISPSQGRYLTHKTTQTQSKRT
jgi:hypothetical protein